MMRADVDGRRTEVMQLAQELFAVGHGRIVRFVVTEPAVDGLVDADGLVQVDLNRDLGLMGDWGGIGHYALGSERRGQRNRQCNLENRGSDLESLVEPIGKLRHRTSSLPLWYA